MKKVQIVLFSLALILVFALGIVAASLAQDSKSVQAEGGTKWRYMSLAMKEPQYYDENHNLLPNAYGDVEPVTCEVGLAVNGLDESDPLKAAIESTVAVYNWDYDYQECYPSDPSINDDTMYMRGIALAGNEGWEYVDWLINSILLKRAE